MEKRPYLLINKIQNYAWGSKNENAFIPHLLDIKPGKDVPYAELWIGTHPKACSEIMIDGKAEPLIDAINEYREELLGKESIKKFGCQFPYLLKVLSAAEALSIQSHPNKEYAKTLHAFDPKNYPDDNHKPEIAIALDELTALAGFKKVSEIIAILKDNPEIREFLKIDDTRVFGNIESLTDTEKEKTLKDIFERLLNNAVDSKENLSECVEHLKARIQKKSETITETEKLFLELSTKNSSDDIGLLVVFFLELIHLKKGEAFFTGAGIPHAYIKGNIVECMANSDNVVRAGLTEKFKDIKALRDIAFYNTKSIEIIRNGKEDEIFVYNSPAEEFIITKIELAAGRALILNTQESFEVLLITEGSIKLTINDNNFEKEYIYKKGNSLLIPANITEYCIFSQTDAALFRVSIK